MTTASSAGAVRGLLRELRSWARYLLPGRYVAGKCCTSAQPAYFSLLNSPTHCTNMQLAERITRLLDDINHMHHSHGGHLPS
jgi:hypothetical protein